MKQSETKQPVVLLVDETAEDCILIRQWLEKNHFRVREATDVFGAIEEMSDFTVRECPYLILLSLDQFAPEMDVVRGMFETTGNTSQIPFFVLSKTRTISNQEVYLTEDLNRLQAELNKMTPKLAQSA